MVDENLCPNCHRHFVAWRYDQVFCCLPCGRQFRIEERRQAIAAWREQQEAQA
jgi:predicted amidophosphoribosyltransferase